MGFTCAEVWSRRDIGKLLANDLSAVVSRYLNAIIFMWA